MVQDSLEVLKKDKALVFAWSSSQHMGPIVLFAYEDQASGILVKE